MYGRQRYKKNNVGTAQPGEFVVMLYDGILRFSS
ncbi:MAG: flagellar protein FliS [Myxococcota bacterium]|nr:flagellar protein FliS [Myxococcota bacterium]